jgi:hypothetical protein
MSWQFQVYTLPVSIGFGGHDRARPGHPHLTARAGWTWKAGSRPALTENEFVSIGQKLLFRVPDDLKTQPSNAPSRYGAAKLLATGE